MFGMTDQSRSRGGMLQQLGQFTSSLLNRAPKPEFELDVRDEGESYLLEADLPGRKREDLHVVLEGDRLTISAQSDASQPEDPAAGNYLRRERSHGNLSRTFDVSEVDTEAITASYRSGVLSLRLPKKHWEGQNLRQVEIH